MDYDFKLNTISDERAYHNTAILIYLKAVRDVLGEVNVRIGNSLNQGYFSYIGKKQSELTESDIDRIRNRMKTLISQDIEITCRTYTAAQAAEKWKAEGFREKQALMETIDPEETVDMYRIDGYWNCMYTYILPSSGYIREFELRPYRKGVLLRLPNALFGRGIPPYRDDDKLYDAYAESKKMRKTTGIDYLADVNRLVLDGKADDLIRTSEADQYREIENMADLIVKNGKRIVLIAGPSSSGKTTTAKKLCKAIAERTGEEPLYLGTDDYFVERGQTPIGPDGKPDYEGLGAIDLELFNIQMEALLKGEKVDLPEFNFVEGHKIFGHRITSLKKGQLLVIEGIHSLNDVMTERIPQDKKFKIYISPLTQMGVDRHNRLSTADTRLLRRLVRDYQFRGYSAEATLEQWSKVRAGESINVFPYSSSGDVVFNSSTVYETNLLRTYAEPLLKAIPEDSPQYRNAQRILYLLKFFVPITSADAVPENAIMREFIGPKKK